MLTDLTPDVARADENPGLLVMHSATFAQLRAEVKDAIVDNPVGDYLPPYGNSETRPTKPQGS